MNAGFDSSDNKALVFLVAIPPVLHYTDWCHPKRGECLALFNRLEVIQLLPDDGLKIWH